MSGLVLGAVVERFGCQVAAGANWPQRIAERKGLALLDILRMADEYAREVGAPTVIVLSPWERVKEPSGAVLYRRCAALHRRDPEPIVLPKPAR